MWVADCWDLLGEEGGWNPRFSRPFNDWEVEVVERFLLTLQGKRLVIDLEDRVLSQETKDGKFFVKSLYSALEPRSVVPFPRNIIWSPCVPTKVGFFAWEASWGKVLTLDQIERRGWPITNRCFLCFAEKESINHILIHCTDVRVLWELLFALFSVLWVLPLSARDTFLGWHGSFVIKKCRKTWMTIPLCLFWSVWKERNIIAFENEEFSIQRMNFFFVCNLWSWSKSCIDEELLPLINFFDWLGSR